MKMVLFHFADKMGGREELAGVALVDHPLETHDLLHRLHHQERPWSKEKIDSKVALG